MKEFTKKILRYINVFLSMILRKKYTKIINVTKDIANQTLEEFSPAPSGNVRCVNEIVNFNYDLQIIVPVYNNELFIEECLNSILKQKTKYKFLVVVINDGSNDKTKSIIDKYQDIENILIINQENRGHSGARNSGLEKIYAKYIAFVDSDDFIEPNFVEDMLNNAFKYDLDIVQGGYYRLKNNKKKVEKKYKEKIIEPLGNLTGFPWAKVWKSNIFKNLHFPENYWYEDSIFSFLIYPQKYKTMLISEIVYNYRYNVNGISVTSINQPKCIDTYWITRMLMNEYNNLNLPINNDYYCKILRQIVLNYKRTIKLPEEIQQCIFVLTRDLLLEMPPMPSKYQKIDIAIRNSDWGIFKKICKYYF